MPSERGSEPATSLAPVRRAPLAPKVHAAAFSPHERAKSQCVERRSNPRVVVEVNVDVAPCGGLRTVGLNQTAIVGHSSAAPRADALCPSLPRPERIPTFVELGCIANEGAFPGPPTSVSFLRWRRFDWGSEFAGCCSYPSRVEIPLEMPRAG